jgi:uncharacterized protein YbbC (DUF1343 family)
MLQCKRFFLFGLSSLLLPLASCQSTGSVTVTEGSDTSIVCAADQPDAYLPLLSDKKVALVVNHTSRVGDTHLADFLKERGVQLLRIFAPEHGFRGEADAGATVLDGADARTGVPLISLYGKKKKPSREDLLGVEVVLFDIQDVGVRFYTYISTLHYVMEACAEFGIVLVVLDRPNPNGFYIDGPVLDTAYRSFVGMHPIPVVHGLTVGELANMIRGEKWIPHTEKWQLHVVPCQNYDHTMSYRLPVRPSPNLPDLKSVLWYPSTCFFEGTVLSLGRGTAHPFQWIGHPDYPDKTFSFTPKPLPGAMDPPLKGKVCFGLDLSQYPEETLFEKRRLDLDPLLHFFQAMPDKERFFLSNLFFDKLAGNDALRKDILAGRSEFEIRASWQKDLQAYKKLRKRYLLYRDFE